MYLGELHSVDLVSAVVAASQAIAPPPMADAALMRNDDSYSVTLTNSAVVKKLEVRRVVDAASRAAECARIVMAVGARTVDADSGAGAVPATGPCSAIADAVGYVAGGGAGAGVGG